MIHSLFRKAKAAAKKIIYFSFCLFPIKKNKVVFENFLGKGYGGNPKYITDELIRRNQDVDIVWVSNNPAEDFPKEVRVVKFGSLRALYEYGTAKVWVDNVRNSPKPIKKKDQFYIQTWHGGTPLKCIEKDTQKTLSPNYIKCAINDSQDVDIMVAETKMMYEIMKRAFWYEGDILKKRFINKNLQDNCSEKVHKYFDIPFESRILFYVPTFRNNQNTDCYDINYEKVLNNLDSYFQIKHVFLIRFHPNNAYISSKVSYNERIFNATSYSSIDELIFAADYVISDYSGCLFDGFYRYKKVFIYASDYENYISSERKMYLNFHDLPAPIATNTIELIHNMINYDDDFYKMREKEINNQIGFYKGDAAEDISKMISELLHDNEE